MEDGSVWSLGSGQGNNQYGQLGDGTFDDKTVPLKVNISDVRVAFILFKRK